MPRKKRRSANPASEPKCPRPAPGGVYRARRPRESLLWRLVREHLDEFLRVYDDRFAPAHGPLRPAVPGAVRRFLRCGILDYGFARIRCPECGDEFL
ncbi:MAG: transposase zinc-binding domain-containing protein, partial [Planctomycetia bacterium]|nr:transposase zinc-binding domain-containing protein [Planctomycetia bacterium]